MPWSRGVRYLRKHSILIIGILLIAIGALGISKCPNPLGQRFSDSLLIAGILSLSVDFYLKRKLQEDAARDIFHHLLGISLPEELREKLQEFVQENAIYRKNVKIEVHVELRSDDTTLITVKLDSTIVAAADSEYEQALWSEEPLDTHIVRASLRYPLKPLYSLKEGEIMKNVFDKSDEPMVRGWKGPKQTIDRGDKLESYIEYTVRRAKEDFYVLFFGNSVISPTLRVTASDSLEIFASRDERTIVNGNEYSYRKVFLTGDHIQIRWRPKERT